MLDQARLIEQHDYYRSLLPQLADWGYNVLHLHLADDQGCALKFPSHPELATKHAFTADEMRDFVAEAGKHGIEVVPEIECWGHTDFITRLKKYRHLREIDEGPGRFSGMCVFEDDAKRLLEDLLTDAVDIFEPRLIHAGLDEVNFGHHPTSQKRLKKRSAGDLFADHIEWCHEVISGLGVRMGMWGDHVYKDERILARTPRDTLIFDWHYEHNYAPTALDLFLDAGFEVWGCPATQHSRNRILSSWENFDNLQRFSGYALERRRARRRKGAVTGMVATVWCPYRYVPGTIEFPLAVAGRLFSSDELLPEGFAKQFATRFWGLRGRRARDVGEALDVLHAASPTMDEYERLVFGRQGHKAAAAFCRADRHNAREMLPLVVDAKRVLIDAAPTAKRNGERLLDLAVAALYLETMFSFGVAGREGDPGWKPLQKAMQAAWARTRFSDMPAFTGKSAANPTRRADRDAIMRHVNRLAAGATKRTGKKGTRRR
jgi:hypothetical protein